MCCRAKLRKPPNPRTRAISRRSRPVNRKTSGRSLTTSLKLLPGAGEWASLPDGGERIVCLPAGGFRFVCGRDGEIGEYHACSLFSPAQEFADHETARAVAAAALEALFDAGNDEKARAIEAPPPEPVSKRDFIRGRFAGTGHGDRG